MEAIKPLFPHDPQAFQRVLEEAAASIDRTLTECGPPRARPSSPPRPSPRPREDKGLAAAPVWPPSTAPAMAPKAADGVENPYDLLRQASRERERAAAQVLAARGAAKRPK